MHVTSLTLGRPGGYIIVSMRGHISKLSILFAAALLPGMWGCTRDMSSRAVSTETIVSPAGSNAAEMAVAADANGNIYVLYVEHGEDKAADVFVRKFDASLTPIGSPVRVNPQEGSVTAWRGDPPTIGVNAEGTIFVGWTKRVETDEAGANDLYLSVSTDGAQTFAPPVKVNDDTKPGVHGMHAMETDERGRVYFAWLDERSLPVRPMPMDGMAGMKHEHGEPNREVYFAVSTDGGSSFSANKEIASDACPCCKVSMTSAADGRLYVSWRQVLDGDFRHFAVASSADGGSSFGPRVIVSDDKWQLVACPVSGSGIAATSDQALNIVWYTAGGAGQPGVYLSTSNDAGASFSPRELVRATGVTGSPQLLRESSGRSDIVFSSIDHTTHIFTSAANGTSLSETVAIDNADLPAAASANGSIYIAFLRSSGDSQHVFVAKRQI